MPRGYSVRRISGVVGKGVKDFHKACQIMQSFKMTNTLDWIKIVVPDSVKDLESLPVGTTIATQSRVYNTLLWTLNPVRIVNNNQNQEKYKMSSEVSYSTVMGHLLQGEEVFRVFHESGSGDVVFEIASYSKGFGVVGAVAFHFIKPLQKKFLQQNLNSMKILMSLGNT